MPVTDGRGMERLRDVNTLEQIHGVSLENLLMTLVHERAHLAHQSRQDALRQAPLQACVVAAALQAPETTGTR